MAGEVRQSRSRSDRTMVVRSRGRSLLPRSEDPDPGNGAEQDDPRRLCYRGDSLAALGRNQEALSSYTRSIEIAPKFESAWYRRAALNARLGNWKRALNDYDQIRSQQPDRADANNRCGLVPRDQPRTRASRFPARRGTGRESRETCPRNSNLLEHARDGPVSRWRFCRFLESSHESHAAKRCQKL